MTALAWGVAVGGITQLVFQFPFLAKLGLLVRPRLSRSHEGVRRILRLMAPAIFGASVGQINLLLDTLLASFLVTGSVSWLYFSDRFPMEFPLGVFGIALATVILPRLSTEHATTSRKSFHKRWIGHFAGRSDRHPVIGGVAVLAGPMLTTLFQYGAFAPGDVRMASLSLMAYAIGLSGFIFVKVLAPDIFTTRHEDSCQSGHHCDGREFSLQPDARVYPGACRTRACHGAFFHGECRSFVPRTTTVDVYTPGERWRLRSQFSISSIVMGALVHFLAGPLSDWFAAELTERALHLQVWSLAAQSATHFVYLRSVFVRATCAARVYNPARD